MGRLAGKVALITGGARGMGAVTARLFVAEGAKVAVADVLDAEGAALAADLGDAARFYHLDVTDEQGWADVVAAAGSDLGPVDVLVNNAGILMFRTLLSTTLEEYERVLQVNLVGQFLGIKAVAPGMIERGKGSIVNISSVSGMQAGNALGAYASSKWGVRGLTKVAALELGHRGIRVNSIHPGTIDTVMGNQGGLTRAELDATFAHLPLQRAGGEEEVAAASLFLASDDASYMAGTEVVVDGGLMAGQFYPGFPSAPGVAD